MTEVLIDRDPVHFNLNDAECRGVLPAIQSATNWSSERIVVAGICLGELVYILGFRHNGLRHFDRELIAPTGLARHIWQTNHHFFISGEPKQQLISIAVKLTDGKFDEIIALALIDGLVGIILPAYLQIGLSGGDDGGGETLPKDLFDIATRLAA